MAANENLGAKPKVPLPKGREADEEDDNNAVDGAFAFGGFGGGNNDPQQQVPDWQQAINDMAQQQQQFQLQVQQAH